MTTPTTGQMHFEMNWELDGSTYAVWKSPIGNVVPFKDFHRLVYYAISQSKEANERIYESVEDLRTNSMAFENTVQHIEGSYKKNIRQMDFQMNLLKVIAAIAVIVAVALGIALLVVIA